MFLRIVHRTRYDYTAPVSFAPHALYLRPRESARQRVHQYSLEIAPTGRCIATHDALDNALDWVYFDAALTATELSFRSELMVETLDANPFDFFLQPHALTVPFTYEPGDYAALLPNLTPRPDSPPREQLQAWIAAHVSPGFTDTVTFLTALNSALHRALVYTRRDEPGIQSAAETLERGTGSCRDYAVALIELCRMLGIAARFVSGYLYEVPPANGAALTPPDMHAWAEVFLPGAGWRGLDATRGMFCDDAYVPIAHAAVAETVNPVQGSFRQTAPVTSRLTSTLTVEKL